MATAVVSASMGAMSTLLPKLSALIQGEYKLQKGVKLKISFLKDELSSMQTLLVKMDNNEERLDEQDKDWRNKVRELSYDIEDCIDLFMHKMSKGSAQANLFKKTFSEIKNIRSRHKMNSLIEELNARAEKLIDCHLRYKFDEPATNFSRVVTIDPRLPALFVEAKRLVGIDGPREKIIELLKEDDYGKQLNPSGPDLALPLPRRGLNPRRRGARSVLQRDAATPCYPPRRLLRGPLDVVAMEGDGGNFQLGHRALALIAAGDASW